MDIDNIPLPAGSKTNKMVRIEESGDGTFAVWDPQDAMKLRSEHRILGSFLGSLPKFTHQNLQLCMPMTLPREAVALLIRLERASLTRLAQPNRLPSASTSEQYENAQNCSFTIQRLKLTEDQLATKLDHAERIAKGRKAKHLKIIESEKTDLNTNGPSTSLNSGRLTKPPLRSASKSGQLRVTEKDLTDIKVSRQEINAVLKEIKGQSSSKDSKELAIAELHEEIPHMVVYPHLPVYEDIPLDSFLAGASPGDRLRQKVYQSLWEKGFYLSGGLKFGCDFLAYPGDPMIFHAAYMVICLREAELFSAQKLESWNRLASQVKKTLLLAYWTDEDRDGDGDWDGRVQFVSSNWTKNLKIL